MNDGHMHGGMGVAPSTANGTGTMVHPHHRMMMHMTFFWGKNSEILFSGWPGTNSAMYALALVFVFFLAFIVECLSHSRFIKQEANHVAAGLAQTLMHALRVGLAYLVMLAVMSFNAGVFIVAVAGHTLGFFFFGSRVFKKSPESVPPLSELFLYTLKKRIKQHIYVWKNTRVGNDITSYKYHDQKHVVRHADKLERAQTKA